MDSARVGRRQPRCIGNLALLWRCCLLLGLTMGGVLTGKQVSVDPAMIEDWIKDIHPYLRWDPLAMSEDVEKIRHWLELHPDLRLKLRLELACLPRTSLEHGYMGAVERLALLRADVMALNRETSLQADWLLARIELDYRNGYIMSAYRHSLEYLRYWRSSETPELNARFGQLLVDLASMMESNELLGVNPLMVPEQLQMKDLGFSLAKARRALVMRNMAELEQSLYIAFGLLDEQTFAGDIAEYWLIRSWQSVHQNSLATFQRYAEALDSIEAEFPTPLLRAERMSLQLIAGLTFPQIATARANGGLDSAMFTQDSLRHAYQQASFPTGLSYRFLHARSILAARTNAANLDADLSRIHGYPGYADRPVLAALVHFLHAAGAENSGDISHACASLKLALQNSARVRRFIHPLEQEWNRTLASIDPPASAFSRLSGNYYYSLILILTLMVVLLLLGIRSVAQKNLNASLQKSVEAARKSAQWQQEAERLKNQFLANVSHDIRTPMNGLVGMVSLLEELDKDPARRKYLASIRSCCDQLMVQLNDLLDFARIHSDLLPADLEAVDTGELISSWEQLLHSEAGSVGISALFCPDPDMPATCFADTVLLSRILEKLLRWVAHGGGTGQLCLSLRYRDNASNAAELAISVGKIGCDLSGLARALESSSVAAANAKVVSVVADSGLGLSLCQKLVEMLGGAIRLESDPRWGHSIVLRVPVGRIDQPHSGPVAHTDRI